VFCRNRQGNFVAAAEYAWISIARLAICSHPAELAFIENLRMRNQRLKNNPPSPIAVLKLIRTRVRPLS
jgi:hypothetical protein